MRKYRHIAALLLVLPMLFVSVSLADSGSAGAKIAGMLARGMSMTDIVVSLENEPQAQAFLAQLDDDTLAFLHLLCERELQQRGVALEDEEAGRTTYIVNTNTDKFHHTDCRHVEAIKEKNRWEYEGSRDDLIRFKYVPCKTCSP